MNVSKHGTHDAATECNSGGATRLRKSVAVSCVPEIRGTTRNEELSSGIWNRRIRFEIARNAVTCLSSASKNQFQAMHKIRPAESGLCIKTPAKNSARFGLQHVSVTRSKYISTTLLENRSWQQPKWPKVPE